MAILTPTPAQRDARTALLPETANELLLGLESLAHSISETIGVPFSRVERQLTEWITLASAGHFEND